MDRFLEDRGSFPVLDFAQGQQRPSPSSTTIGVSRGVPFVLAGLIRDDGPGPDTGMDLIAAQAA